MDEALVKLAHGIVMMKYPFEVMDELQFNSLCFAQQNTNLYAVIEGGKPPQGYQTTGALIYTLEQQPTAHPLLISLGNNDLLDVSPWLVKVTPDSLLYYWLIENSAIHPFVLFWSQATLQHLVSYMVNLLTVTSPQGGPLFFRYYDPTVLAVMITHGSDSEMFSRMGPVSGVAAFSDAHESYESGWNIRWFESTEPVTVDPPLAVTLNESEWQAMGDLRSRVSIKQMMSYLRDFYPDHLLNVDSNTLQSFVTTSIDKGRLFGFNTQAELEQWVDLQIYFGNGFEHESRYSWAKTILDNPQSTPGEKLQTLNLYLDQYQARSVS